LAARGRLDNCVLVWRAAAARWLGSKNYRYLPWKARLAVDQRLAWDADHTVSPANGRACLEQWIEATGVDKGTGRLEKKPWGKLSTWGDGTQRQISFYSISGLPHGLPVKGRRSSAPKPADPFVVKAGISAPIKLLRLWHLPKL